MLSNYKRFIKSLLIVTASLFFIVFSVVNRTTVHVSLFPLPYSAEIPQFLFAVVCFIFGLLVGWAFAGFKLNRSQKLLKSEHKQVMALKNEVALLHTGNASILPAQLSKT